MVVGSLCTRLGDSALSNLDEKQGTHRNLVRANAGKANLGHAAEPLNTRSAI